MKLCSVDGCDKKVLCRGWCRTHYTRWYETGSTELGIRPERRPPPPITPTPIAERFWAKVDRSDAGGCWLWLGGRTKLGYGMIWSLETRGRVMAHRLSWELAHGEKMPHGAVIDHLCRNPRCVNPDHLEAVTVAENTRRGLAPTLGSAYQRAKTHCPQGHPYSGANLYITSKGGRMCKTCNRASTARRRARLKAQRVTQ